MEALISVRDREEARGAVLAGARMIDLKEPDDGALGGVDPAVIGPIVAMIRVLAPDSEISATVGDPVAGHFDRLLARAAEVAACGVDYVKVGVEAGEAGLVGLQRLSDAPWQTVPVFLVDHGFDLDQFDSACRLGFPALMVDTEDKTGGHLFDWLAEPVLARLIALARRSGCRVGLSGSLRSAHLSRLAALGPDFAGFRGEVCATDRTASLVPARVRTLVATLTALQRRSEQARQPAELEATDNRQRATGPRDLAGKGRIDDAGLLPVAAIAGSRDLAGLDDDEALGTQVGGQPGRDAVRGGAPVGH